MDYFNAKLRAAFGFIRASTLSGLVNFIKANGKAVVREEDRKKIRKKILDALAKLESSLMDRLMDLKLTFEEATEYAGDLMNAVPDEVINAVALANDCADFSFVFEGRCEIHYRKTDVEEWLIVTKSDVITTGRVFEDGFIGGADIEESAPWDNEEDDPILGNGYVIALALPRELWGSYGAEPPGRMRMIEPDGEFTNNAWND